MPKKIEMVTVAPGVQLEVLDFGGSGSPPLIFLAGMGNTAHIWDNFAPLFTDTHHVYAITRRGFGASSAPKEGYGADRLADDVLAVMDKLSIQKPVLVGHSLGGEEMTNIGDRFPTRVSGLIYLDAEYDYAFHDSRFADAVYNLPAIETAFAALRKNPHDNDALQSLQKLLPELSATVNMEAGSAAFRPGGHGPSEKDTASFTAMRAFFAKSLGGNPPEAEVRETFAANPDGSVGAPKQHDWVGGQIYANMPKPTAVINVPILAIAAAPKRVPSGFNTTAPHFNDWEKQREVDDVRQADAFAAAQPNAKVIKIANANHYVFISNEAEVQAAMEAFLTQLGGAK